MHTYLYIFMHTYIYIYIHLFMYTYIYTHTHIIIIIIITSRHQDRYLYSSLATLLYRSLLPAGLQDYIPYWHRAVVCRF